MSSEFLSIIPVDPRYVPTADVQESAVAAFARMLPMAESIDAVMHREICFIDAGMKFETVSCPLCGCELDPVWWSDAMDAAQQNAFENLEVTLPCCDSASTLNNLTYRMPSGFARFALQAREPKLGRYLTVDKLQALESILGTPLKQIWSQHRKRGNGEVRTGRRAVGSGR